MVRKQNRKENLINQATHNFTNVNGVVCYGLVIVDDYFALNPELTKWVQIPKWAFIYYFGRKDEGIKKD